MIFCSSQLRSRVGLLRPDLRETVSLMRRGRRAEEPVAPLVGRAERDGKVESLWGIANRPRASKVLVDEAIAVIERVKDNPFFCELWINELRSAHTFVMR